MISWCVIGFHYGVLDEPLEIVAWSGNKELLSISITCNPICWPQEHPDTFNLIVKVNNAWR
jgi:hypothetical protein